MSEIELLKKLINGNGSCVNLGRIIQREYEFLHNWIMNRTLFLDDKCKYNERIYCVINNIEEPIIDAFGKKARFVNLFIGYSLKTITKNKNDKMIQKELDKNQKSKKIRQTRIELFIKRNKKENSELYSNLNLIEGYDYFVCPILGVRVQMITKSYITRTLEMDYNDYVQKYPNLVGRCPASVDKVKNSLHKIDTSTGMTPHQISIKKSRQTLTAVDPITGLTGDQLKGQKTRNTHMSKIDENGNNGYQRIASKAILKGNKTKADKGLICSIEDKTEFDYYKRIILSLTEWHRKEFICQGNVFGLAGTPGASHMDHKFSIFNGWKNKISPILISNIKNIEILLWEDNLLKHTKSSISKNDLFILCDYDQNKNDEEFNEILKIIQYDLEHNISPSTQYILERYNETKIL